MNAKFSNAIAKVLAVVTIELTFFVQTVFAASTQYPLTINNCGREITFNKKPERAVTIGQNSTEILYTLGLANKVKGTSLWYSEIQPKFAEINAKVKVLSANTPSFESIVQMRPDIVANHLEWAIGKTGAVATYEEFNDLRIPVYTAPADCLGKDNQVGGDGLRIKPFEMDMIYQEIAELAKIFDVQPRGEQLIAELKSREEKARKKVAHLAKGNLSAVFWYSSANLEIDPYVAGQKGAPSYIMDVLGIKNVITSDHEWPTIGWETIVKADPTIIVLAEMNRRRFPADDVNVRLEYLKKDPVTKLMSAVRNNRILFMDAQSMNATMRTLDGIERLVDEMQKVGLLDK